MNVVWLSWRPMFLAPKDGTLIITLMSDYSGVSLIRYGQSEKDGTPCWIDASNYVYELIDNDIGWIPVPEDTPDYVSKVRTRDTHG